MFIAFEDIDASLAHLRNALDDIDDSTHLFIRLLPEPVPDPNNLLSELLSHAEYRGLITAFLESCVFDENFRVVDYNYEEAFIRKFDSYNGNSPDIITVHSDFVGQNFSATQYATFNLATSEFTYTKYVVTPDGSAFNRTGTGKLPLDTFGYFQV